MESPNVSKLSKEELQVIADEEEAERVYQAELAAEAAAKAAGKHDHPVPKRKAKSEAETERVYRTQLAATATAAHSYARVQSLISGDNPAGPQILRTAPSADPQLVNFYVQGVGPPYGGIARWVEVTAGLPDEQTASIILAALSGQPDPMPPVAQPKEALPCHP